jgi:hypothetical protein
MPSENIFSDQEMRNFGLTNFFDRGIVSIDSASMRNIRTFV